MIRRKTWNSDAPSMRAASMISSGIALMAAESTTIANPVWIQIMITISSRLFHGCCDSHGTGFWPSADHDRRSAARCSCRTPRAGSCR